MMAELQRQHHAELELMYLDAACHYGLYGSEQVSQFSPFHDQKHYAGAPPSVQYLKAMFVDYISAHRVFIDCAQACLPADVMKVDHTFDVNLFCYFLIAAQFRK
jgi:hypothetical protein